MNVSVCVQVGPAVGAAFLQSSGLDNAALGLVWEASDVLEPKGQLTKPEVCAHLHTRVSGGNARGNARDLHMRCWVWDTACV